MKSLKALKAPYQQKANLFSIELDSSSLRLSIHINMCSIRISINRVTIWNEKSMKLNEHALNTSDNVMNEYIKWCNIYTHTHTLMHMNKYWWSRVEISFHFIVSSSLFLPPHHNHNVPLSFSVFSTQSIPYVLLLNSMENSYFICATPTKCQQTHSP